MSNDLRQLPEAQAAQSRENFGVFVTSEGVALGPTKTINRSGLQSVSQIIRLPISTLKLAGFIVTDNGDGTASIEAPPQLLAKATVTLTAAQIKNLVGNDIEVVPAQGANKIIVPLIVQATYHFGTAQYDSPLQNAECVLYYDGQSSHPLAATGANTAAPFAYTTDLFNATADVVRIATAALPVASWAATDFANIPLTIANEGGENFTTGDGTLTVTVYYSVVTLA